MLYVINIFFFSLNGNCPSMEMKSHLKEHFHNAMPIWTFFVITLLSSFFPSNWIKNIKIWKAYKWSSKEIYIFHKNWKLCLKWLSRKFYTILLICVRKWHFDGRGVLNRISIWKNKASRSLWFLLICFQSKKILCLPTI